MYFYFGPPVLVSVRSDPISWQRRSVQQDGHEDDGSIRRHHDPLTVHQPHVPTIFPTLTNHSADPVQDPHLTCVDRDSVVEQIFHLLFAWQAP